MLLNVSLFRAIVTNHGTYKPSEIRLKGKPLTAEMPSRTHSKRHTVCHVSYTRPPLQRYPNSEIDRTYSLPNIRGTSRQPIVHSRIHDS